MKLSINLHKLLICGMSLVMLSGVGMSLSSPIQAKHRIRTHRVIHHNNYRSQLNKAIRLDRHQFHDHDLISFDKKYENYILSDLDKIDRGQVSNSYMNNDARDLAYYNGSHYYTSNVDKLIAKIVRHAKHNNNGKAYTYYLRNVNHKKPTTEDAIKQLDYAPDIISFDAKHNLLSLTDKQTEDVMHHKMTMNQARLLGKAMKKLDLRKDQRRKAIKEMERYQPHQNIKVFATQLEPARLSKEDIHNRTYGSRMKFYHTKGHFWVG